MGKLRWLYAVVLHPATYLPMPFELPEVEPLTSGDRRPCNSSHVRGQGPSDRSLVLRSAV